MKGKQILACFLAALMCITTISTDTLAAALTDEVAVEQEAVVGADNEAPAEEVSTDVTTPLDAPEKVEVKVDGQNISVTNPEKGVYYNIIKSSDIPKAGIKWAYEGSKHLTDDVKSIVFEKLEPNTKYVVYAIANATEDGYINSAVTKSAPVTTAKSATLKVSATNGTVVVKCGENVVKSGAAVASGSTLTIETKPNKNYKVASVKIFAGEEVTDADGKNGVYTAKVSVMTGTVVISVDFVKKEALTISINAIKDLTYDPEKGNNPLGYLDYDSAALLDKDGESIASFAGHNYQKIYKGSKLLYDSESSETKKDEYAKYFEENAIAGTEYTVVMGVHESEKYQAAETKVKIKVAKKKLEVKQFEVVENKTYELEGNKITLKADSLSDNQAYAVSAATKAPAYSETTYKTYEKNKDLEFDNLATGKKYYVYAYALVPKRELAGNYDIPAAVKSKDSIEVEAANIITVTAPTDVIPVFVNENKVVPVTITNLGNKTETIGSIKVNDKDIIEGAKKTIKAGASIAVNVPLTAPDKPTVDAQGYDITVSPLNATEVKTVTVKLMAYEKMPVKVDEFKVADGVAAKKGKTPKITFNATAKNGTKFTSKDVKFSFEVDGADDTDFSKLTKADIYTIKAESKDGKYNISETAEYVVKNTAPAKINKKLITVSQTSISINTKVENVEVQVVKAGEKLGDSWSVLDKNANIIPDLTAGTKYVLYYRTKATDAQGKTASAPVAYKFTTASPKKLTVKSSSTKLGTVEVSDVYEEPKKKCLVAEDTIINLTAVANDGAYFDGWYIGKDRVEESDTYSFKMPNKNVKIVAKFVKIVPAKIKAVSVKKDVTEITADTIKFKAQEGYKYYVTTEKVNKVDEVTEESWAGYEPVITIEGLKPKTKYYIYSYKEATDKTLQSKLVSSSFKTKKAE